MPVKLLLSIGSAAFVFYSFIASHSSQFNTPPAVTITAPTNGMFQWNSVVPYAIRVSDKEDGNSEYNEIAANEVLLMVAYLPDSARAGNYLSDRSKKHPESLLWMSTSTCFNCHAAKAKLIGPSFEQIARRYPDNSISAEVLAKKIITGSSGAWGDLKMPPHPDLKIEEVSEVVRWILKNGADPDRCYFAGIEGAFRTKEKTVGEPGKGIYILSASYTDHGMKGSPQTAKLGEHTVILKNF